jgi:hypothetical protein
LILLAVSYAVFKLLGILFYKVANIKTSGKRDQMGGALVGFLRGWLAVSFLTFLIFLLPMPDGFYTSFDNSFFGSTVIRTIPIVYDNTKAIHPRRPAFMGQIENTLLVAPGKTTKGANMPTEERQEVHRVIYHMDRIMNPVQ